MRAALGACAIVAVVALSTGLPPGPVGAARAEQTAAARTDRWEERLGGALETPALRGAGVAALVVDAEGRVLYERSPDRPLIPASNLKILTALAVLDAFGPTHRFVTELSSEAPPGPDGAIGTLYVRGAGDPALTSEDCWRMAADLRRLGVRTIGGGLVLDDRAFDAIRWNPGWGRTGARAYHAPVGALTVNYGAFAVTVTPGGQAGAPVRAVVDPPVSYLALTNRGRTGPARARSSLVVDRRAAEGREEVLVRGAMPAGGEPRTFHRSVLDPARYAGAVLEAQLRAVGISVSGAVRRGDVPEDAAVLVAFEGAPMSDVVRRFMKYSNNQIGESLLKSLGARANGGTGSWPAGTAAVRARLAALGLPLDGAVIADGSGLSYENRVSPRLLVAALRRARADFRFGAEFEASLPIAAHDGTLEERADEAEGRVRAKTGLLTRVTGLSGYGLLADGRRVTFSVLANGYRRSAREAMDALDGFVAALVRGGRATGVAAQDRRGDSS